MLSDAELHRTSENDRRSVGEVGARIVDEWLHHYRLSEIELCAIDGQRVACLRGRLEVWQVIMVARRYDDDIAATARHLNVRPGQVQAAFDYAAAYPEEIELALFENGEGFEILKQLRLTAAQTTGTAEHTVNGHRTGMRGWAKEYCAESV